MSSFRIVTATGLVNTGTEPPTDDLKVLIMKDKKCGSSKNYGRFGHNIDLLDLKNPEHIVQ